MPHGAGLIVTITAGLVAALIGGFIATRLRMPTIVGYLVAGIAIGPFTPGFTGDVKVAAELAEIGVILLMFGVGIHFSLRRLLAVQSLAVPGALGQIFVATALGGGLALSWGWGLGGAIVLGLALSVASTVVLLRGLEEQDLLDTGHGRVAVGWLIVEDLVTILILVMLPALAVSLGGTAGHGAAAALGGSNVLLAFVLAVGKTALFVALMLFVGARAFPWFLMQVARTNSRELFTLSVLAVALGVAVGSAMLLGVSLALGAFLAGMVISESDQSHQAAADALPLRDAFAVLFFVSVGMLFNPSILMTSPGRVLAVVAIIIVGKALAGFALVALFKGPLRTGLVVAVGLAQIGEFSFIVAELGRQLQLLPDEGYQLLLAGALISISLNPLLFRTVEPLERWIKSHPRLSWLAGDRAPAPDMTEGGHPPLHDHAIICGYGRVGSLVTTLLQHRGIPCVVLELNQRRVDDLRSRGTLAFFGDAANPDVLRHAGLDRARVLVLAMPDPFSVRRVVEHARALNPEITIIARTHSESEWIHLLTYADEVVLGEREAALEIARATLTRFDLTPDEALSLVETLRGRVELGSGIVPELRLQSLQEDRTTVGAGRSDH
ncbi:MAG: cation:proton antiporter [Armatimonadota bacterium]